MVWGQWKSNPNLTISCRLFVDEGGKLTESLLAGLMLYAVPEFLMAAP